MDPIFIIHKNGIHRTGMASTCLLNKNKMADAYSNCFMFFLNNFHYSFEDLYQTTDPPDNTNILF